MLDFRYFFCVRFSQSQESRAFVPVASRADVVSPAPRYAKFKKQQLEGKNFKDLNSY